MINCKCSVNWQHQDDILVTINQNCTQHSDLLRLVGKFPGFETNIVSLMLIRQFSFPVYKKEILSQFPHTRLGLVMAENSTSFNSTSFYTDKLLNTIYSDSITPDKIAKDIKNLRDGPKQKSRLKLVIEDHAHSK